MADIATDLKQQFEWAMDLSLEAYEVLPDGKSFVRSDEDENAITLFKDLLNSVDAIPSSLIASTEKIRAAVPELFEKTLALSVQAVKAGFLPTSATEFVETLNQAVKTESLERQPAR
jgi:hypothetical protein